MKVWHDEVNDYEFGKPETQWDEFYYGRLVTHYTQVAHLR